MATEADIPASVCKTRPEQGGNMTDQATNISINKLLQEEKTQVDTPNEPPTLEGESFLGTPSTGEVYCKAYSISTDATEVTEEPDQAVKDDPELYLLRNPKTDNQPLEIAPNEETSSGVQHTAEESNVEDKEEDKSVAPEQCNESENLDACVNTMNEKTGDGKITREDISFNLTSGMIKEGDCPNNQNNMTSEQKGLGNKRNYEENLEATSEVSRESSILMKTKADENSDVGELESKSDSNSSLSQKDMPVQKGDSMDEKIIRKVGSQKEALEITSNEEIVKDMMIKADCAEMKTEEHLESGKTSSSLPLAREAGDSELMVKDELQIDDRELKNAELCENEEHTEGALLKIESKVEKAENTLHLGLEVQEVKTRSSFEEQSQTTHAQGILDEITDNKKVDAATKEEPLENVAKNVSNENNEENLSIQFDGSQMKDKDHLKRESEKPSLTQDFKGNAKDDELTLTDEIKIEDKNPERVELLKTENNTESAGLIDAVQVEKPVESFSADLEHIRVSHLGQYTETESVFEENLTETQQGILGDKTEGKKIDAAATHQTNQNMQNAIVNVPNEDIDKKSLIQVNALQMKNEAHMDKEVEKPSTEASTKDATEDCKASVSSENIDTTYYPEEQSLTANPEAITSNNMIDASDRKEVTLEVLQNIATTIPHEHTEDNSAAQEDCTHMDYEEHEEKGSKRPSVTEAPTEETNDNNSRNMNETKTRDEDLIKAELLENEKNTGSTFVKDEAHLDQPIDSLQVATENMKTTSPDQDTKISSTRKQIQTADPQDILGGRSKETTETADTKEESVEDFAANVPNQGNEDSSPIEEDGSKKPTLKEASDNKTSDSESGITSETKIEDENSIKAELAKDEKHTGGTLVKEKVFVESLQVATKDIIAFTSSQDRETISLEEQSLTAEPQGIIGDNKENKTKDAIGLKEETPGHEDTETNVQGQENKDSSPIKEDGSQKSSLKEASTGNTSDNESTSKHETTFEDEGSIKARLLENEKTTNETSLKEEASPELLQEADEDTKASASNQDRETNCLEEQSLNVNPQGIIGDHKEDKINDATSVKKETPEDEDMATNVPNQDNEDSSQIEHDGPQQPSLEEDSTGNTTDTGPTIMLETKFEDEISKKAESVKNEKKAKIILVKEEVFVESLQVVTEDIKAFASSQDRETNSLEEQSSTADLPGITGDHTEDKTNKTTGMKKETCEDENVATAIPYEDTKKDSLIKVDDSTKMEQTEHVEKESENSFATETLTVDTTENILVKEEAQVEKPINSLQVSSDDSKASASGQDIETSSVEEQILTAGLQENSDDKREDKTIDSVFKNEKIPRVQGATKEVSDGDNEENLPVGGDDSQEPSMKEDSTWSTNGDKSTIVCQPKYSDNELIKHDLVKNEKNIECTLGKEESSTELLQIAGKDIKASVSVQDTETCSLEEQSITTNTQGIMGDHKEDRKIDMTDLKEETPAHKDVATTSTHEETKESSLIQVDCSQMEQKKHLEDSENSSIIEVQAEFLNESTLVKEEMQVETGSFHVSNEDIKAIETSSIEKLLNTQEVSIDKTEEQTIDAASMNEETIEVQHIATRVQGGDNEDNLQIEVDGSQSSSVKEVFVNKTKEDDSALIHEAKFEDKNAIIADCAENEKNMEDTSVNEEASIDSLQVVREDVKSCVSQQDTEKVISLEQESLTTDPEKTIDDHREQRISDATDMKEETSENMNPAINIPQEGIPENSLVQVNCSQLEYEEHLEQENENLILTESPKEDTTKSILLKEEEAQVEKCVDYLQVTNEDVELCVSSLDTEISSIKGQIASLDLQEIPSVKTEEKTTEAINRKEGTLHIQDVATDIPRRGSEDNSKIKLDSSQEPSLKEDSTGNGNSNKSIILSEATIMDESFTKSDLFKDEKNLKGTSVRENASIESLQLEIGDIKKHASSQDQETSFLEEKSPIENLQGIMGQDKEDKTIDPTHQKEETLKDEKAASIVPNENSVIQAVCSEMEQDEHLERKSKIPSLNETLKSNENDESKIMHETSTLQDGLNAKESITEKADHKESEVIEDMDKNKCMEEQLEKYDTAKSLSSDQKQTESEQEERECRQENVLLDETEEDIKEYLSTPVTDDLLPKSSKTSEVYHATSGRELTIDTEELHTGKTTGDQDEEKIDEDKEEASKQVSDFSSSTQNLTEVQSCNIISKAQETRIDEENLEGAAKINSNKVVAEDRYEPKETMKVDNLSSEIKEEDEHVEYYHLGSSTEEIITESRLEEKAKQEKINKEEAYENKSNANEIEKASKLFEEAADKDVEEPEKTQHIKESTDKSLHQEELGKCAEEATILDSVEARQADHVHIETGTEGSRKEIETASHPKDEVKQEEINTEDICEVKWKANETKKISEVSEEAMQEQKENFLAPETIDGSLPQKEQGTSIVQDTTTLDAEEARLTDHLNLETKVHYSREEKMTESHPEYEVKPEELNSEKICEVNRTAYDTGKVSKSIEKAVQEPEENSFTNDDRNLQQKIGKSTEEVTTLFNTEEVQREANAYTDRKGEDSREKVITESHPEDEVKPEETEEVKKNENETDKVSKVYEEAAEKAVQELEEDAFANVDRSLHQKELGKNGEEVTTIVSIEEVRGKDNVYIETKTEDSREKVIMESHPEGQENQEETKKDLREVTKNPNETENVSRVFNEASEKDVQEPGENSSTNVDRSLNQNKTGEDIEEITPILDTEEAHQVDHTYIEKRIKDSKEDIVSDSCPEDEVKQKRINTEEIYEVKKTASADETEKVSEVFEEAMQEAEEKFLVNESIDGSLDQNKQGKSIKEVKNIVDEEKTQGTDHVCVDTNAEDSTEEIPTESYLEYEVKQEEINREELCYVKKTANEIVKVTKVSEESAERAVQEPEENLFADDDRSLHQKELAEGVEEFTTLFNTEVVHGEDNVYKEMRAEGSRKKMQVPKVFEKAAEKTLQESEETSLANVDISILQTQLSESIEGVTTIFNTKEVRGLEVENVCVETRTEDSREKVSKIFEETAEKAVPEPERNILANESIDGTLHQNKLGKGIEEVTAVLDTEEAQGVDQVHTKTETEDSKGQVSSSIAASLEDEDNKTRADDDDEMLKDEGLLNQNSNACVIDAAAEELPERPEEKITCEDAPTKTVHQTTEDSEGKKQNADTITVEQQEEGNKEKHESLPPHGFTQEKESEKVDQKVEICNSNEALSKDEDNLMLSARESKEYAHKADVWIKPTEDEDRNTNVKVEKVDISSHAKDMSEDSQVGVFQDTPKHNENFKVKNDYADEKYLDRRRESQMSTVEESIELIEQASKATRITAAVQETIAGSNPSALPNQKATEVKSQQEEEASDRCKGTVGISTSIEPAMIFTSKSVQEYTVGTSLEAKGQIIKLHNLPQESRVGDSGAKTVQIDVPVDLQNIKDIGKDVQELNECSIEVPNEENPVEAGPNEKVSSEVQEPRAIQNIPIPETLEQEIEERQSGRAYKAVPKAKGVNSEEEKATDDECNDLTEDSSGAASEIVPESSTHQISIGGTAQSDKNQGLDDIDVMEPEVAPLPAGDKHAIQKADLSKNVNPEDSIGNKEISVIQHEDSEECSRSEGEILKPSNFEQEEANCKETANPETMELKEKAELKELDKPSLLDLLESTAKETMQMAGHSAIVKEPTVQREEQQADKNDNDEHDDAKTDEEKDGHEESSEQRRSDLGSEAPIMVDTTNAGMKVAHKKSHNILSGVGSKVKHSISKVKKAITGKSSHPKPPSPK